MRIVFFGSGAIGVPSLRWLASQHEIAGVVTQPDRPSGRSLQPTPPPTKSVALELGLRVYQPIKIREPEVLHALQDWKAELFVVAAYGQILPKGLLDIPALGTINIHASLLPRHRGASPIQATLLAGDSHSGITIMWVDEGLDTGDILLQKSCPVYPDDTAGSLHDRLALLAPEALGDALTAIANHQAPRLPQDHSLATYAPKLSRHDAQLDFREDGQFLERKIRAFHPWPGAWAALPDQTPLKIHRAAFCTEQFSCEAGAVSCEGGQVRVACGKGALELLEVQGPGGRRMSAAEYFRGHPLPSRLP